jgi:hypothetical protein
MPWQRRAAQVALELVAPRTLAVQLVALSAGRRSGKTELAILAGAWRCLAIPGTRARITAQTRDDAAASLIAVGESLMASPFAARIRIHRGRGGERLAFTNGSLFLPYSPLPDALHSKDSDHIVIDEAWQFDEIRGRELLAAAVPTMATRSSPQLWVTSAAGTDGSTWWTGQMQAARDAGVLVDYGLGEGVSLTVESVAASHPAVGHTITAETVAASRGLFPEDEWIRAFGNRPTGSVETLFPPGLWASGQVVMVAPDTAPAALGVDVTADRSAAAVYSAEWLADGRVLVERVRVADGVGWVADLVGGLVDMDETRERLLAVGVENAGPARVLFTELELTGRLKVRSEGNPGGVLASLSAVQVSQAHARFYDLVLAGKLVHRPDPDLDAAAAGVVVSPGRSVMTFSRSRSGAPVHPLLAAAAAVQGLVTAPSLRFVVDPDPMLVQ